VTCLAVVKTKIQRLKRRRMLSPYSPCSDAGLVKFEQSKPDVVHISIEDTGTGINPSNLEQVFSPLRARKVSGPQISGIRENSSDISKGKFLKLHLQARVLPPQPRSRLFRGGSRARSCAATAASRP
jgi:hypothetical protein